MTLNWLELYATMARIRAFELAAEVSYDSKVQKYLAKEIVKVIRDLKV